MVDQTNAHVVEEHERKYLILAIILIGALLFKASLT